MATVDPISIPTTRRPRNTRRPLLPRERFTLVLWDSVGEPDIVKVRIFDRCAEAMGLAHSYCWPGGERVQQRKAGVWCGSWILYDADTFEVGAFLRGPNHPVAPGNYIVEVTADDRLKFYLQKASGS